MKEMSFFEKSDIGSCINDIEELLSCGIFTPEHFRNILFKGAFVQLIISLNRVLKLADRYDLRVSFSDDIDEASNIKDITDLIYCIRNSLCHPESDSHFLEKGRIKSTYNVVFGAGGIMEGQISRYGDDVCFFFGTRSVYLNRHIIRAFIEVKEKLKPFIL